MSISFKPTPKRNPRDIEADPKYYATAVANGKAGIDELAARVADASTVSRADTYAVIISLLETIIKEFQAGRNVDLGKLGRFAVSLSSEGTETPQELQASHIRKASLNFYPGKELKRMLGSLEYHKTQ